MTERNNWDWNAKEKLIANTLEWEKQYPMLGGEGLPDGEKRRMPSLAIQHGKSVLVYQWNYLPRKGSSRLV